MIKWRLPSDRALAECLQDAVVLLDKKHRLVWWNAMAATLFKLQPAEHRGGPAEQVFADWGVAHALTALVDPTHAQTPQTVVHKHISMTVRHYKDQQILLLAQDISQLRHLEHMRQDFVANVSHELRTPLTVMHGYLEVLLDQAQQQRDESDIKMYQHMLQQSVRMENIVEDLLRLANLERPGDSSVTHVAVDVDALLHTLHEEALTLSGAKQHDFILDSDPTLKIFGEVKDLRSAFSNIIFNAVHYTPEQGRITIRWRHTPKGAEFSVEDTGMGIAEKHIPRLTERFYRADKARARASGGTGLGLAIVKHILLRHDTVLEISSVLGKGSTFSATFPVSRICMH